MTLDDIEQTVASMVTTDRVVARMFLDVQCDVLGHEHHVRRAFESQCQCPYCSVIKLYVRAKIRVRRIERQDRPYMESFASVYNDYLRVEGEARDQLTRITVIKKETPKPAVPYAALLT